jgi:hypothetical protein
MPEQLRPGPLGFAYEEPNISTVLVRRLHVDVRTHTLHDPVAYKRREVGAYLLRDELPEPTWYS